MARQCANPSRRQNRLLPQCQRESPAAQDEAQKFVLLPEAGTGNTALHDVPIFEGTPGEVIDRSTPLCQSNVPALSEHFIGRQQQMHKAVQALTGKRRCVCLVGAGGIGKSALAVAVCDYVRLRHVFCDGTFHVDARGLADVQQLTYAIASALQLTIATDATERMVRDEVIGTSPRSVLLYIDRCDDLTSTIHHHLFGELVSTLLRRAPKFKLLLTCRKSLGVADENPLNIPMPELNTQEAKTLLQNMAPGRVASAHATALAELCGNMPLALRLCGCALASQRVQVTPDQLIARLEGENNRLRKLTDLSKTTGDESVEACIASSYNSLSPQLQLAFLALCEFPGNFTAAAAASLLVDSGDERLKTLLKHLETGKWSQRGERTSQHEEEAAVDTLMQALIDDSMIELLPAQSNRPSSSSPSTPPPERRHRLHELIRLYGSGRLAAAGPAGEAAQSCWRERMVIHFTTWLGVQSDLYRTEATTAIQSFDTERHNVEAVPLTWSGFVDLPAALPYATHKRQAAITQ